MGFESYFLIVWDFVRYAKENGIAVGPGRGSAAGSIVAYSLDITDLDPLANDLLFERFLNPARKSMPDIDIDFSVRGRERVIRYVAGEVRPRVGRADHHLRQDGAARGDPRRRTRARLRLRDRRPHRKADPGADHGPQPELRRVPLRRAGAAPHLRLRSRRARIVDVAKGLEGIVRNNSIHAAAVVIADRPLDEIVPLQLAEDRGARRGNGNGNGVPERPTRS